MIACDACLRRTDLIAAIAGRLADRVQAARRARRGCSRCSDDESARGRRVGRRRAALRGLRCAGRAGAGDRGRAEDGLPMPGRVPGARCVTSRTRPRCCTCSATRARSRTPTAWASWARGAHRRTGSTSPGRSGAGSRRRTSPSSRGSRSASTPPRTPARSKAPGRTIGVLAASAHVAYPARGHRLHAAVAARGAVISEMPPGASAHRWCFVARNRIIAALAAATVVVQATERSGSLTTADFANELGRAVGAVPGPVTTRLSGGTHSLIQAGAPLIRDAADALELLAGSHGPRLRGAGRGAHAVPALEPRLAMLLAAVEDGHGTLVGAGRDRRRGALRPVRPRRARTPRPGSARVRGAVGAGGRRVGPRRGPARRGEVRRGAARAARRVRRGARRRVRPARPARRVRRGASGGVRGPARSRRGAARPGAPRHRASCGAGSG